MSRRALPTLLAALVCALMALPLAAQQVDSFPALPPTSADRPAAPDEPVARPALAEWSGPSPEIGADGEFVLTLSDSEAASLRRVRVEGEDRGLFLRRDEPYRDGDTWKIPVTILVSGEEAVGPFTIEARTAANAPLLYEAPALSLEISQPVVGQGPEKDYTPVLDAPFNWVHALKIAAIGLVVLAMLAALGHFLWRRLRQRDGASGGAPRVPIASPIDEATHALAQLEDLSFFSARGARAHYGELSMLLRRYFERQHGFPALEMTEDEMDERLRLSFIGDPAAQGLLGVFANASMAKFAKWTPREDVARADLASAAVWLASERRRLAPAPAQEEAAA